MFIEHEKTLGNDVWRKLDSWCRDLLSAQLQFIVEHLLREYHFSLRSSISVMSLGSIA
jgi:hypothetical protein